MKNPNKILVTDYILDLVEKMGVGHVFGVTGGAIAFQLDAFSRNKKLKFITMQHEQAAAMAVEAYSRINGYGVGMATSGPGATNLITGVCGCWFDSIPALFITGQVPTIDQRKNDVRQKGFQEAPVVELMKPITKYSGLVADPKKLSAVLERAINESINGRMGPVHVDLSMDVQKALINYRKIKINKRRPKSKIDFKSILSLIKKAKRPVLVVGNGVRLAGGVEKLRKLANVLRWPVLPSWTFADFIHEYRVGLFGIYGNRGANFTIQNSDLILAIGTRLDPRMTGSNPKQFARKAKKIIVDIDINEIKKGGVKPDIAVLADACEFINGLLKEKINQGDNSSWLTTCLGWGGEYGVTESQRSKGEMVTPYALVEAISGLANEKEIVVADTGANLVSIMQAWKFKKGQSFFSSFGNSPMGYALPAAIGASFASGKRIMCLIGDGGIQMNIQELQTVVNYHLPIKIFVFSNHGYGLIRQFQDSYLGGRYVGTEEEVPDFKKIGEAYGIRSIEIRLASEMEKKINEAVRIEGAVVVNVMVDPSSIVEPKAVFPRPIEEQSPPLSDEEIKKHMLIERWQK